MGKNLYFKFTFLVFLSLISLVFVNSSDASEPIEFILAWDANAEEDIDGYEIYFRNPYSDFVLLGDVYVEELADPDNPMVTITDVYNGGPSNLTIPSVKLPTSAMENGEIYYFAITAFDGQGNISDFSEEICLEVVESSVTECVYSHSLHALSSVDVNSDSGGSSGGCFISTNSNDPNKIELTREYLVMYPFGMIIILAFGLIRRSSSRLIPGSHRGLPYFSKLVAMRFIPNLLEK